MKTLNNWKYEIKIKDYFEDKSTPESVEKLCSILIKQLRYLNLKIADSNIIEDYRWDMCDKLEELAGFFEFTKNIINGTIPKEDWDDYAYDGNYTNLFNDYLYCLYKIADERVVCEENGERYLEKFLWVG